MRLEGVIDIHLKVKTGHLKRAYDCTDKHLNTAMGVKYFKYKRLK